MHYLGNESHFGASGFFYSYPVPSHSPRKYHSVVPLEIVRLHEILSRLGKKICLFSLLCSITHHLNLQLILSDSDQQWDRVLVGSSRIIYGVKVIITRMVTTTMMILMIRQAGPIKGGLYVCASVSCEPGLPVCSPDPL